MKASGPAWQVRRLRATLQRLRGSLLQRGFTDTLRRIAQQWRAPESAAPELDLIALDLAFAPFALPTAAQPDVSVIVPVHGQLACTLACLRSIARHGARTPFELIVVDDASPDASAATLAQIAGLRLLQLPQNRGFVGACNAGAEIARARHLLFLNNDTQLPQARIELLSNIHRVEGRHADFAARRDLLFIGGFGHPPNVDAVRWFATAILPLLRAELADIVLHVVGDVDDRTRRELAAPGLQLHGRVAELAPWLDGCRLSLAPLRFGADVKGKISMAMSRGLPVIATTLAAEAMGLEDGRDVLLADTPDAFAAAVLRAYADEALWLQLSDGGLANVRTHFSPEAARATLQRILASAENG